MRIIVCKPSTKRGINEDEQPNREHGSRRIKLTGKVTTVEIVDTSIDRGGELRYSVRVASASDISRGQSAGESSSQASSDGGEQDESSENNHSSFDLTEDMDGKSDKEL